MPYKCIATYIVMFFIAQLLRMPPKWTTEEAHAFWRQRQSIVVTRPDNLEQRPQCFAADEQQRHNQTQSELEDFYQNEQQHWVQPSQETLCILHTAENLTFCAENQAWSYCDTCHKSVMEKMQLNYANRPPTRHTQNCVCSIDRYIVPVHASIPASIPICVCSIDRYIVPIHASIPLLMLSPEEIELSGHSIFTMVIM